MDGFDDPFWTLEQVLGWIITGSRKLVAETSADSFEGDWACRAALLGVLLESDEESSYPNRKSLKQAEKELLVALQSGKVVGNASFRNHMPRVDLDPKDWLDVKVFFDESGLPRIGTKKYPYSWGYTNIMFEREAVLAVWPKTNEIHTSLGPAEKRACEWFVGLMRESPSKKTLARGDAFNQASAKFKGLSRRAAQRAWATAIQETDAVAWSFPGRPKKSAQ